MASIPNESFFPGAARADSWRRRVEEPASIPEAAFYGDERPPAQTGLVVRLAARPAAMGASLFLLGWLGILVQRSFATQLVVGAPVFEEFAKFGLALILVAALGARGVVARLPYAWLSGLAFGVLEHFISYPEEPWLLAGLRAGFHASMTGLSMALYSLIEPMPDARMRWVATIPASLLHWANNFGVVVAALALSLLTVGEDVVLAWSVLVGGAAVGGTFALVAGEGRLRPRLRAELERVFPPMRDGSAIWAAPPEAPREEAGPQGGPDPRSTSEPASHPPPSEGEAPPEEPRER